MTGNMDTLVDRMRQLRAGGWSHGLSVAEQGVRCDECTCWTAPEDAVVDDFYRFEGESDPDDESILFAVSLPCGHRGVLPASYGKDTTPEIAHVLKRLPRQH